jgi:hypothetical protein
MADLPEGLLDDVKEYLNITWQDDKTDKKITGYINRGMKRLQDIAGASLDFTAEDLPRALLLDYCRYANSQALEVFEKNFEAELLDLHLSTQAPIVDSLTITAKIYDTAIAFLAVAPKPDDGNSYVYRVGVGLTTPSRLDTCIDGFTVWDGGSISVTSGQEILIVEVNDEYGAERAGTVVVGK